MSISAFCNDLSTASWTVIFLVVPAPSVILQDSKIVHSEGSKSGLHWRWATISQLYFSIFSNDRHVAWGQALLCWEMVFFFIRLLSHSAHQCLECVNKVMFSRVGRESTSMHLSISQNTFPIISPAELIVLAFAFFGVVMWCNFLQYSLFWIWSGGISFCYWSCPEWNHYLR